LTARTETLVTYLWQEITGLVKIVGFEKYLLWTYEDADTAVFNPLARLRE